MSAITDLPNREPVIANIQQAVQHQDFNAKVELGDPQLDATQAKHELSAYLDHQSRFSYRVNNLVARTMLNVDTRWQMRHLNVVGKENLAGLHQGAIVTSNHFSPYENMVVRRGLNMKRLYLISQLTNFDMNGLLGYMMRNIDTIPLTDSISYIGKTLPNLMANVLDAGHNILIYPEQEMWFNYRKPRLPKRGAYQYAAQLQAPIISCFVEMTDTDQPKSTNFYDVTYTLHILPVIYPDPQKTVRENSFAMMQTDYEQKCAAYETAYQQRLTYDFQPSDIAGWAPRG
ncbi:acyl-phosphate glycerol 3-phosphate acyltransferase [Secundilactobacillus paracollinoides]|uniref:lysophospholipid acyltransferase family protein n=1 Tax=Secundilactobacillus paracollinoides TaxID=240427 RepID=UPI00081A98B3|nr:lysophospholipid acyltransferase family protein [Secundilactobacillus paracollinoides]ANZ62929.1 acyl-phosphate glycerol 3-phosphate acyltransferase [Secundilactobacillus paracollinoides]